MKSSDSPERIEPWLTEGSDASPALRDFLREANAYPEDAARVARLRQRLGPWLAASTPPSLAPSPGTGVASSSTLAAAGKACLFALGSAALVVSGGWLLERTMATPTPSAPPPVAPAPPSTTRRSEPPPSVVPAPPVSPAPAEISTSPASPKRAPKAVSSLAEEAAELFTAQRALASSPANALALLRAHAEKFPRGALAEERYVFTIEALVALSRPEDAKRELSRLERGYPRSAHLTRARRLVGIDASPP